MVMANTTLAQTAIMIFHVFLACVPWTCAIVLRDPTQLFVALGAMIVWITHYLLLDECILTQIETPGEKHSFILEALANFTQSPVGDVKNAFTLIEVVAPITFMMGTLAGILKV